MCLNHRNQKIVFFYYNYTYSIHTCVRVNNDIFKFLLFKAIKLNISGFWRKIQRRTRKGLVNTTIFINAFTYARGKGSLSNVFKTEEKWSSCIKEGLTQSLNLDNHFRKIFTEMTVALHTELAIPYHNGSKASQEARSGSIRLTYSR